MRGGSAAQQKRVLPEIAQGRCRMALAHVERGARYDLAHVAVRARRQGDGFVLDGDKHVGLHGAAADVLVVSARTAGAPTDPQGISLFLVDRNAPGVTVKEFRTIDELRAAEVNLSGVAVPRDALIGLEGAGLPLLDEVVDYGTALLCAEAVGPPPPTHRRVPQDAAASACPSAVSRRPAPWRTSSPTTGAVDGARCAKVDTAGASAPLCGPREARHACRHVSQSRCWRHGHDRGAEGQPHLPAADPDRPTFG
jgi:hypothetical protein